MKQLLNKRTLTLEKDEEKDLQKSDFKKGKKFKRKGKMSNPYKGVTSNPVEVHFKNPQITKDLCSVPFTHMMGFPLKAANDSQFYIRLGSLKTVCHDWFAGISKDYRSFLNSASTNRWTFVRSRNAGATNYQASDLYISTTFACVDIILNLQYIRRAFGLKSCFSVFNRLMPKMVFDAMGIDYEDFINNIANYRGRYNIVAAKASALVVPKLNFIDYELSFYESIFKDRDSSTGREQLYMVIKPVHHIYDATSSPNGGQVRLMTWGDLGDKAPIGVESTESICTFPFTEHQNSGHVGKWKLSLFLDIIEEQLNRVITDEDCNIMFGDMIKAYGDTGNFYKPTVLPEDYSIDPVYSEEFLVQMHNASPLSSLISVAHEAPDDYVYMGLAPAQYKNTVGQDENGYITTDVTINTQLTYLGKFCLLDTNDAIPTAEKVMLMTRWKNFFVDGLGTNNLEAMGPALIWAGEIYISDAQYGATIVLQDWAFISQGQGSMLYDKLRAITACSNFDWDFIKLIVTHTSGTTDDEILCLGDVNNMKSLNIQTLREIHQVDFASLFEVPFSGNF